MHEFFFENLRNPAHNRRAGLMRQFRSGQLDSKSWWIWVLVKYPALVLHYLEAGVSQLTGEKKIDYREYLYSGTM